MELAEECEYCGTSFENWVLGKIMFHLEKHIDKGDCVLA